MEKCRQLARVQNTRHSSDYFIETKTSKFLKRLREEHYHLHEEELKRTKVRPSRVSIMHQEVAHAYDGPRIKLTVQRSRLFPLLCASPRRPLTLWECYER